MKQVSNIEELETAIDENGEMVVAKNKNKIVVMNIDEYREKFLKKEIEKHLLKAEDDIENGRVKDAITVFKEWKAEYGI